jgi:hypothetical protein
MGKTFNTGTLVNGLSTDANGNVGIGTSTPNDLFEVRGGFIRLSATSGNGPQFNLYSNGQTNSHVTLAQGFSLATDNIGYLYNRANAAFVFGTNNTERMRITSGGNVGIGTNNPLTTFDVRQAATGAATVNVGFRDSSTNGNALQIWNGNNEARFRAVYYGTPSDQSITFYTITSAGAEGERMRISSNGNVGIGTSNPSYYLDVAGDAKFGSNSSNGNTIIQSNSTPLQIRGRAAYDRPFLHLSWDASPDSGVLIANTLRFNTGATLGTNVGVETMRITSGGHLEYRSVPNANYNVDTSPVAMSIASGGVINFGYFSGMIIVNNHSNGVCAVWVVGAGTITLLGKSNSGTEGSMTYNGGIVGYTWTSTFGGTALYGVYAIKTRNNA